MSQVLLIAADHPLPLCDRQHERTETFSVSGKTCSVTAVSGFRVGELSYYRDAVELLGHEMKPYRYELETEDCAEDLAALRSYLAQHFTCGEEVELWNLWVGSDDSDRPGCYRGTFSDFDEEAFSQFLSPPHRRGGIGQCRMTITFETNIT